MRQSETALCAACSRRRHSATCGRKRYPVGFCLPPQSVNGTLGPACRAVPVTPNNQFRMPDMSQNRLKFQGSAPGCGPEIGGKPKTLHLGNLRFGDQRSLFFHLAGGLGVVVHCAACVEAFGLSLQRHIYIYVWAVAAPQICRRAKLLQADVWVFTNNEINE